MLKLIFMQEDNSFFVTTNLIVTPNQAIGVCLEVSLL